MDEDSAAGLPASYELLWGLRERPGRGPKPGLSLRQVLRAGVDVAQAEGLGAVSMSRVARELGTSAMSLYRYVASKDELLQLMVDEALGDIVHAARDDGWRAGLERWAWAELDVYRRHLWALQVPVVGPPLAPKSIAFMEQGLRCLAGTPLEPGEKMSVILTLTSFTRSWVIMTSQINAAAAAGDGTPVVAVADYGKVLATLTTAEEYPALHEVLAADVFGAGDDSPDEDFVFGLARLMDGFEVLIQARGGVADV